MAPSSSEEDAARNGPLPLQETLTDGIDTGRDEKKPPARSVRGVFAQARRAVMGSRRGQSRLRNARRTAQLQQEICDPRARATTSLGRAKAGNRPFNQGCV